MSKRTDASLGRNGGPILIKQVLESGVEFESTVAQLIELSKKIKSFATWEAAEISDWRSKLELQLGNSSSDRLDLNSLALIARLASLVPPWKTGLVELTQRIQNKRPSKLSWMSSVDERSSIGEFLSLVELPWVSSYLLQAALEEDGPRARRTLLDGWLERCADLKQAVSEFRHELAILFSNSGEIASRGAARVVAMIEAVRDKSRRDAPWACSANGSAVSELLDALPDEKIKNWDCKDRHKLVSATETLWLSLAGVSGLFGLKDEVCRGLEKLFNWRRAETGSSISVDDVMPQMSRRLLELIELRARWGLKSESASAILVLYLGQASSDLELQRIAEQGAALDEPVRAWLLGRSDRITMMTAQRSWQQELHRRWGEALVAAEEAETAIQSVDAAMDVLSMTAPEAARVVEYQLKVSRCAVNTVIQAASESGMRTFGSRDASVVYDPDRHELIEGLSNSMGEVQIIAVGVAWDSEFGVRILRKARVIGKSF